MTHAVIFLLWHFQVQKLVPLLLLCSKASPKGNDIKESSHFMMIFYDWENGLGSVRGFSPGVSSAFMGSWWLRLASPQSSLSYPTWSFMLAVIWNLIWRCWQEHPHVTSSCDCLAFSEMVDCFKVGLFRTIK